MDAASMLLYRRAQSHWRSLTVVVGLLCLLGLLAFAAGIVETGPAAPADGNLVGPFRWQPVGPKEG